MATRREIREAAVQFLYCADIEDTTDKERVYKTFWSIVLESDEQKLIRASAKAILHLNQGRTGRFAKLVDHSEATLVLLKSNEHAISLVELFKKILERENGWQALCDRLAIVYKQDSANIEDLEEAIEELYVSNHVLMTHRNEFFKKLEDFPSLSKKAEATLSHMTAMDRISKRFLMIEEPENFPEQTDIMHLRNNKEKISQYREAVDYFVSGVLNNKDAIDEKIASVVLNFKPERIDPVDRAVIRLATYEILFEKETPIPVVINEAIEIVRRFGSNESAKFANGILDNIRKSID